VTDETWTGFTQAVVQISMPSGPHLLRPDVPGRSGRFPFAAPVHIITAYNPAGHLVDADSNRERAVELDVAVAHLTTFPTIGSAPDGSCAEPGHAIFDIDLATAVEIGRRFGQRAIYAWTPDSLDVIALTGATRESLGWQLDPGALHT
jgi:hypothetical protein